MACYTAMRSLLICIFNTMGFLLWQFLHCCFIKFSRLFLSKQNGILSVLQFYFACLLFPLFSSLISGKIQKLYCASLLLSEAYLLFQAPCGFCSFFHR